jgi:hypothetical protein
MRLRKFYRQLARVRKSAFSIKVNGQSIRIYFTEGDSNSYCPLTAVARDRLQVDVPDFLFQTAARAIDIPRWIAFEIAESADWAYHPHRWRRKQIRAAMMRALGLSS